MSKIKTVLTTTAQYDKEMVHRFSLEKVLLISSSVNNFL